MLRNKLKTKTKGKTKDKNMKICTVIKYLQNTLIVLNYNSMTKTMHYVWGSPALYMVYGVFRIILYYYGGITKWLKMLSKK